MWRPNYLFSGIQHGEQRQVVETKKGESRNTERLHEPAFGNKSGGPPNGKANSNRCIQTATYVNNME
jgi:hypothetical protein